jgi:Tfp pilus assembly protein PilO
MMAKGFDLRKHTGALVERFSKDPRIVIRVVLGLLLLANLLAAFVLFRPWWGSPEELQGRLARLQADVRQRGASVERLRKLLDTVQKTNTEAGQFIDEYFLNGRSAYLNALSELDSMAQQAGIKRRGDSITAEPVEGSDTLAMLVITGNYEGTYSDLIRFVNAIDRSPRFVTIESLQAAPQQSQGALNIVMRLNLYTRGQAGAP